jgi:hypothetical protein
MACRPRNNPKKAKEKPAAGLCAATTRLLRSGLGGCGVYASIPQAKFTGIFKPKGKIFV